ncbi:asparagine synthetase (WbpS) [Lentisphaera araneosa HTCC2155]|uniref:asparagine synthase (glutamine-hydrolyzing) n=1 Tax=Lentisphaera araneosa HTCC2155 TaxID=313628 RepID=A6DK48_9BACT|nr:asparagine synthase (glutamine-hydrolyzing) [Lentisphaera araneosa]EDM27746.1 asparagine synthetase (WbpS) [Lentisphaera araneosa HTCC2155]
MCGIAGFLSKGGISIEDRDALGEMVTQLDHRGPDANGKWFGNHMALGHTRLSIIELSPAGAQPMHSACGRYVISFNGEIYNSEEIRSKITTPYPYQGNSDTETILAAISYWGVEEALTQFNGMFVAAVWDRANEELKLFRDHLGKKPLFYAFSHHHFLFASELNSLKKAPSFNAEVSQDALHMYMQFGYVPAPYSIFKNCYKLRPGHILSFSLRSFTVKNIKAWWDLHKIVVKEPTKLSFAENVEKTESLLEDSIRLRLNADVPVGAFLSGGIDSSLICAMAAKIHPQALKTFSIGFDESQYNESAQAEITAKAIGADHTTFMVQAQDALKLIPKLPHICDEPFADSSILPTTLISQLARKQVTVAIGGDGGDEIFCGYERYLWGEKILEMRKKYPNFINKAICHGVDFLRPATLNKLAAMAYKFKGKKAPHLFADKAAKFTKALRQTNSRKLYRELHSLWSNPNEVLSYGQDGIHLFSDSDEWPDSLNPVRQYMFADLMMYLSDDILQKADRASMSTSLELRSPLIDHRLVEHSWTMSMDSLIGPEKNMKKRVLKSLLGRHLPDYNLEAPKQGFAVPIAEWLRGDLKDWAQDLINDSHTFDFFYHKQLQETFQQHLSKRANHQHKLWAALMFIQWHKDLKQG